MVASQPAQPFDQAVRQLLGRAPREFARVVLGVDLPGEVRCLPTQLFTHRLEVDGLVVEVGSDRVVHVEFQTRADRGLGRRMLRYRVGLEVDYDRAEQHVVLLHPDADFGGIGEYEVEDLSLSYRVHRVWEMDPDVFLATPVLAPLAVLGRAGSVEARVVLAERALGCVAGLGPPVGQEAVSWLYLLGNLYLGTNVLDQLIRRSAMGINIEDFPVIQELMAKGRAEGRAEARIELVAHQVRLKYGDEALVGGLAGLDPTAIEEAAGVLLRADRDAFAAWLRAHQR